MQTFSYTYFDQDGVAKKSSDLQAATLELARAHIKRYAPEWAYDFQIKLSESGSLKDIPLQIKYKRAIVETYWPAEFTDAQIDDEMGAMTGYWTDGGPLNAYVVKPAEMVLGPKDRSELKHEQFADQCTDVI